MAQEFGTSSQAGAIAQSIARAGEQYDAVPYSSFPFARMQPERFAAVARLLGLEAPDPKTARSLEIGCASGGHLIPLAARYPKAQFVGIDISQKQIADGQARITRLGLGNITLAQRSLTELGPADGKFDTIICHGVYSWIPDELRESLLQVCHDRLAPEGIALVSYNVLPGWRLYQAVRDSMLVHAGARPGHAERAAEMRRLFALLAEHTDEKTSYGSIWRKDAPRMTKNSDAYLAHELLEENNAPSTVTDFVAAAGRHGLAFLAETTLMASIPENHGPTRSALIRELAGDDPLAIEQYIDIVTGRTFRQTLLVHEERASRIQRALPEALPDDVHLLAPINFKVTAASEAGPWTMADGEGAEFETADPSLGEAVMKLAKRVPASSTLNDLAPLGDTSPDKRNATARGLMHLLCTGILEASTEPAACAAQLADKPKIWPLAASDATVGLAYTSTLRHTPFEISPQARFLMPLTDGTRDREALAGCFVDYATSGGVQISERGVPVTDTERLREICRAMVGQQFAIFTRAGLVAAELNDTQSAL